MATRRFGVLYGRHRRGKGLPVYAILKKVDDFLHGVFRLNG
ncbi:MAG: hypothetical protein ACXWWK_07855 [Gemmatimonadales bacterium]